MGFATSSILDTITDLVGLAPRATGTPGGAAAADYVRQRFESAGLQTEVMETPPSPGARTT